MQIRNAEEYRRALSRISELEAQGKNLQSSEELALLEGAVARYISQEGEPDSSKGKPPLSERTRRGRP